jgi:hypothetical protein
MRELGLPDDATPKQLAVLAEYLDEDIKRSCRKNAEIQRVPAEEVGGWCIRMLLDEYLKNRRQYHN